MFYDQQKMDYKSEFCGNILCKVYSRLLSTTVILYLYLNYQEALLHKYAFMGFIYQHIT